MLINIEDYIFNTLVMYSDVCFPCSPCKYVWEDTSVTDSSHSYVNLKSSLESINVTASIVLQPPAIYSCTLRVECCVANDMLNYFHSVIHVMIPMFSM